jgi:hypothetical protein
MSEEKQIKVLNDFAELISDLEIMIKREKRQDYKNFIDMIKQNVALFRAKLDYFLEHK